MTEATIQYLRVQADEDVYTQMVTHDTQIKESLAAHDAAAAARLAAHDAAISAQLARHDADIKALLQQLRDGQLEIIRLLLTPEGRRSSTVCPSGPCRFPLK